MHCREKKDNALQFAFLFSCFVLAIFIPPPPPLLFLLFQSFSGSSRFLFVDPVFFSVFVFLWHFHGTRTLSAFAKQITVLFSHFSKLYFVFDFVPFFRFLTLSFSSQFVCSKVPWKRTGGKSCPKRRDKENSCAGAEGELKACPLWFRCWAAAVSCTAWLSYGPFGIGSKVLPNENICTRAPHSHLYLLRDLPSLLHKYRHMHWSHVRLKQNGTLSITRFHGIVCIISDARLFLPTSQGFCYKCVLECVATIGSACELCRKFTILVKKCLFFVRHLRTCVATFNISRRVAGEGELFGSDARACTPYVCFCRFDCMFVKPVHYEKSTPVKEGVSSVPEFLRKTFSYAVEEHSGLQQQEVLLAPQQEYVLIVLTYIFLTGVKQRADTKVGAIRCFVDTASVINSKGAAEMKFRRARGKSPGHGTLIVFISDSSITRHTRALDEPWSKVFLDMVLRFTALKKARSNDNLAFLNKALLL